MLLAKAPNCIQRYRYKPHFIHLSYPVNQKRVITKFKSMVNLLKSTQTVNNARVSMNSFLACFDSNLHCVLANTEFSVYF